MSKQRQAEIEKIRAIKHEWLKSKGIILFEEFAVDKGLGTASRFEIKEEGHAPHEYSYIEPKDYTKDIK